MNAPSPADSLQGLDCTAVLAAVRRVVPAGRGSVPLHEPEFRGNERQYAMECLDSGWVSSVGSYVDRFEASLADYTGAGFAVATVNGTAALHVCLQLAGVERGDEVLLPSLTFIATANAVSYAGATPHFVDAEPRTLGVDVGRLDDYLRQVAVVRGNRCVRRESGATIRALIAMHTFGLPGEMDALVELCERWHLKLVEDAAESLGSFYKGRHTGNFGVVSALSFNGNKIVTTGGGGAILTSDAALARKAKHVTTTARVAHEWSVIHDEIGYNYRMPNINAALGCAQLEQLAGFLERKRVLASRYEESFRPVRGVRFVSEPVDCRSNYWLNAILLDAPDSVARDAVLRILNDDGLMARPAWAPVHELPMYRACPKMDLTATVALATRIVNLPSSACLVD